MAKGEWRVRAAAPVAAASWEISPDVWRVLWFGRGEGMGGEVTWVAGLWRREDSFGAAAVLAPPTSSLPAAASRVKGN